MTDAEYTDFCTLLHTAWPGLEKWLDTAGTGTQTMWRDTLIPLDYYPACETVRLMHCGNAECPDGHSTKPAAICKQTWLIMERNQPQRTSDTRQMLDVPEGERKELALWAREQVRRLGRMTDPNRPKPKRTKGLPELPKHWPTCAPRPDDWPEEETQ
jgi:hypothetical protein